jgi:BioD-like phosphotransacetylase family protein
VAGGEPEAVIDDVAFLSHYVALADVELAGLIVNQVKEVDDFEMSYRPRLDALGMPILGVVPFEARLSFRSLRHISEMLFGKVIAGEENIDRVIQHILVGATSVGEAITRELTRREGVLVITSGDRGDVIVAALQAQAAGIVLTNSFLPAPTIVAQATQRGTPLVLVSHDTFQAAKIVDDMEPLLTAEDHDKLDVLTQLVRQHVDLGRL